MSKPSRGRWTEDSFTCSLLLFPVVSFTCQAVAAQTPTPTSYFWGREGFYMFACAFQFFITVAAVIGCNLSGQCCHSNMEIEPTGHAYQQLFSAGWITRWEITNSMHVENAGFSFDLSERSWLRWLLLQLTLDLFDTSDRCKLPSWPHPLCFLISTPARWDSDMCSQWKRYMCMTSQHPTVLIPLHFYFLY